MLAPQQTPEPATKPVPAGQGAQAVVLPRAWVPVGHVWHAVDTPSTKKVPTPQQTAVRDGVQRFVWLPVHAGVGLGHSTDMTGV